ncbi:MAG: hypothetical protein WCQ99_15335, partial [Pseudomonadota bacterium]
MKGLKGKNSFGSCCELETKSGRVLYYALRSLIGQGIADIERLPFSIKILLEALLRSENGVYVTREA